MSSTPQQNKNPSESLPRGLQMKVFNPGDLRAL
jgi:hypothetical protein